MSVRIENVCHWITFESPIAAGRSAVFLEHVERCIEVRGRVHVRGPGSVARSTEAARPVSNGLRACLTLLGCVVVGVGPFSAA